MYWETGSNPLGSISKINLTSTSISELTEILERKRGDSLRLLINVFD